LSDDKIDQSKKQDPTISFADDSTKATQSELIEDQLKSISGGGGSCGGWELWHGIAIAKKIGGRHLSNSVHQTSENYDLTGRKYRVNTTTKGASDGPKEDITFVYGNL
jgi:hypothetical protein